MAGPGLVNVHVTLPTEIVAQLRAWASEPRRISRVIQRLVLTEQGRLHERELMRQSLEKGLQERDAQDMGQNHRQTKHTRTRRHAKA
jgi:hypothetical protein